MTTVINLCPHAINVADADGNVIMTYEPSGMLARVAASNETVAMLNGVAVKKTRFGEVTGIPAPATNVVYLVSTLVAQAAGRADCVAPDTGPTAVRANGQVVAVRGFQTF